MTTHDNFSAMLDMQQALQMVCEDGDPTTMQNNRHRIAFMRWQFEAMIHELCEAQDEMGWKPWGKNESIHPEEMVGELVDAFHFFLNWLLTLRPLLGLADNTELSELFFAAYVQKNHTNVDRIMSGIYDGFTEKCPQCGRERETAKWEEEEIYQDFKVVRTERYLVCKCGNVFDYEAFDKEGEKIG